MLELINSNNKKRSVTSMFALVLSLLVGGPATPAFADEASLQSSIVISYGGIPVGRMDNRIDLSGSQYSISGKSKTNSFISVVKKGSTVHSSSGRIDGRTLRPGVQSFNLRNGKKNQSSKLVFEQTNVVEVSASPAIKYKPGSIPITAEHTRDVIDPVSAMVFPVAKGEEKSGTSVCNRQLDIFNGKHRLGLSLRFKRQSEQTTKGFSGAVFTCLVNYTPIAGHRPNSKSTTYIARAKDIEMSFAEIGTTGVFALIGFSLPTRVGLITGKPRHFRLLQN